MRTFRKVFSMLLAILTISAASAPGEARTWDLLGPEHHQVGYYWDYQTHVTVNGGSEIDWWGSESVDVADTETVDGVPTTRLDRVDFDDGYQISNQYFTNDYLLEIMRETETDVVISDGADRPLLTTWIDDDEEDLFLGTDYYWGYSKDDENWEWEGSGDTWISFLRRDKVSVPAGVFPATKVKVFYRWRNNDGRWGEDRRVFWVHETAGVVREDYLIYDYDPWYGEWNSAWSNKLHDSNLPVGRADLLVAGTSIDPAAPNSEQPVDFYFTVQNNGNADAGDCAYGIWVDGYFYTSDVVPALAAGYETTIGPVWLGSMPAGAHRIEVEVDIDGEIPEESEANNAAARSLNVPPAATPTPAATATPTPSPTPRPTANPTTIETLIEHFYLTILNRPPEQGALAAWKTGYFEYALAFDIDVQYIPREMGRLFFLSDEYAARQRSDDDFIRDCYAAFLHRQPTSEELGGWSGGDWNRAEAMSIFAESEEFVQYVRSLFPGFDGDGTRNFVTLMYIGLLDRLVDAGGLAASTRQMNAAADKKDAAKQLARSLIDSEEFLAIGSTNEDRVVRLYRAFFGRYPSDSERVYWAGQLASSATSLDRMIDLFADSAEFTAILNKFF